MRVEKDYRDFLDSLDAKCLERVKKAKENKR